MKTAPTILAALLLASVAAAPAQNAPPAIPHYYLAEVIPPPPDPAATANAVFQMSRLNSQNYALFEYTSNQTGQVDVYVQTGIYTGKRLSCTLEQAVELAEHEADEGEIV